MFETTQSLTIPPVDEVHIDLTAAGRTCRVRSPIDTPVVDVTLTDWDRITVQVSLQTGVHVEAFRTTQPPPPPPG